MESGGNYRREIGGQGEDIACRYLEDMGHTILERNWRSGHLEVDIITYKADGIHFVEVKTRFRNIQAPPQDNVDRAKQKKIAAAALRFLKDRKIFRNMECSFDVVAVTLSGNGHEIEFFEQAFIPIYT